MIAPTTSASIGPAGLTARPWPCGPGRRLRYAGRAARIGTRSETLPARRAGRGQARAAARTACGPSSPAAPQAKASVFGRMAAEVQRKKQRVSFDLTSSWTPIHPPSSAAVVSASASQHADPSTSTAARIGVDDEDRRNLAQLIGDRNRTARSQVAHSPPCSSPTSCLLAAGGCLSSLCPPISVLPPAPPVPHLRGPSPLYPACPAAGCTIVLQCQLFHPTGLVRRPEEQRVPARLGHPDRPTICDQSARNQIEELLADCGSLYSGRPRIRTCRGDGRFC